MVGKALDYQYGQSPEETNVSGYVQFPKAF